MSSLPPPPVTRTPPCGGDALALYIHWPFCKSKCPYCDFNSHVREALPYGEWKKALLAELEYMHNFVPEHRVQSIFFGGGTPSLMPPDIAEALIARAKALWCWDDAVEITLEANPTSVEADTFPAFKQAGINRLSLGVQSLIAEDLKFLGREHSAEEALKAITLARKYFERYSFDLIYARPQQTVAAWADELEQALALAGDHLSLYQLTIEENTAFHTAHARGDFTLPDEDTAAEMYLLTEQLTADKGLFAYEISNYAQPGGESRHNLAYWRGLNYAGIGPGAHGRLGINHRSRIASADCSNHRSRYATLTIKSPERWLASVQAKGNGVETMEVLSEKTQLEERLMMGLRLKEGMIIEEWMRPYLDENKRQLAMAQGLLVDDDNRLIATLQGRLVLTSLTGLVLKSS